MLSKILEKLVVTLERDSGCRLGLLCTWTPLCVSPPSGVKEVLQPQAHQRLPEQKKLSQQVLEARLELPLRLGELQQH